MNNIYKEILKGIYDVKYEIINTYLFYNSYYNL